MTIRHMINNEFYAKKAEEFCNRLVMERKLSTETTAHNGVITIVVKGVEPTATFGEDEALFIK